MLYFNQGNDEKIKPLEAHIIPQPVAYETTNSAFLIDDQLVVDIRTENEQTHRFVELFKEFLSNSGIEVKSEKANSKINSIIIDIDDSKADMLGNEGYTL